MGREMVTESHSFGMRTVAGNRRGLSAGRVFLDTADPAVPDPDPHHRVDLLVAAGVVDGVEDGALDVAVDEMVDPDVGRRHPRVVAGQRTDQLETLPLVP